MKTVLAITLAVALIAAAVIGYSRFDRETVTRVQAIKVERGDLQAHVKATGIVTSRDDIAVVAPVAGTVISPLPAVGTSVRKGALLARIDSREAAERRLQAEAALAPIEEEIKQLRRNHQSLEKVWAAGGEARRSVDDALSALNIAIARRGRAQADVNAAKVALELYTITSPISGIVTTMDARRGEFVPAAKKLLSLAAIEKVQVKLKVDQSAAELVRVGQSVELAGESGSASVEHEKIIQIEPAIQKDGSTDILVAWVSLSSGLANRRLEQQVDARILTAEKRGALKIPFEAISTSGGKEFVRVVDNGKLRNQEILTGIQDARSIEVVKGLSEGQLVVRPTTASKLKEGDRVEVDLPGAR